MFCPPGYSKLSENIKAAKISINVVLPCSLWFSFYYTGEKSWIFDASWLNTDGESSPESLLPSFFYILSLIMFWISWPLKQRFLQANILPSADLLKCFFSVSISIQISSQACLLGNFSASAGSQVNVIIFWEIIGHGNIAEGIFYSWQSDIQVNFCSHRHFLHGEILGLKRTLWHICEVFFFGSQFLANVLPSTSSVKWLIKIQSWWILQRWTGKHLSGTIS